MTWALALTALVAAIDWWAVYSGKTRVEAIAKPLVMLGLVVHLFVGPGVSALTLWIGAALLLGLIGDVLLLPMVDRFELGLASFLFGHVAWIAASLVAVDQNTPWFFTGAVVASIGLVAVGGPIARAVQGSRIHVPVAVYTCAVGLLIVFMFGTALWMAMVGALLFAGSDALLGWTRFVNERDGLRPIVHVTYHVGQALLVLGLT